MATAGPHFITKFICVNIGVYGKASDEGTLYCL